MAAGSGNGAGDAGPVTRAGEAGEVERVQIKVNGVEIEVTREVRVQEIVEIAKGAGAIEGLVEEYVIERVKSEGEIEIDTTITVAEKEEFLAVPVGKTEVA